MQLISDSNLDARHPKPRPGSYEWWYFDGISEDGDYQVVIIYYDGCPFSTRYVRDVDRMHLKTGDDSGNESKSPQQDTAGSAAVNETEGADKRAAEEPAGSLADQHPAISISVYHKGEPIFYSLSEYPPGQCSFSKEEPAVTIGANSFRREERETHGSRDFSGYDLRINERLPSGDELKGIITFTGMIPNTKMFGTDKKTGDKQSSSHVRSTKQVHNTNTNEHGTNVKTSTSRELEDQTHLWNLVFPRANMQCRINLLRNGIVSRDMKFDGIGYHDHNVGTEPMRQSFRDWYWGRVHFPEATLVYYVMNKKSGGDYRAWLISSDNRRLLYTLDLKNIKKRRFNGFLLRPGRELQFGNRELDVTIRHKKVSDSGPFYCRYITEARLTHPSIGENVTAAGIGEYIRPARIHRRIFWPLVHMRLRYVDSKPHWVQKSPRLYRWTW